MLMKCGLILGKKYLYKYNTIFVRILEHVLKPELSLKKTCFYASE